MLYMCKRCGKQTNHLNDLKKHLNIKKPCKALYADIDRATLLNELKSPDGKKMAVYAPSVRLESIKDKDAYIVELERKVTMLQKGNLELLSKLDDAVKTEKVEEEVVVQDFVEEEVEEVVVQDFVDEEVVAATCNKCGLEGIEDMEAHIRECELAVEFDNVYSYNEATFGRSLYGKKSSGEIYIIQTDFVVRDKQYYKIGKTTNIERRMVQFRTGAVCEPRLHCYFPFRDLHSADVDIKKALRSFNVKREIYSGDIEEIKGVIRGYQRWVDGCIAEFAPALK